jgi:hypothetical protein
LPALADADHDGLPDFWELQFGLDPKNPTDATALTLSGYATIEHYLNNTDPRATDPAAGPAIVFLAATSTRASAGTGRPGAWRIMRSGSTAAPLTVRYTVGGDALAGQDYPAPSGTVTIPAGATSVSLPLTPLVSAADNRTAVITLTPGARDYFVGCPSRSLIVIRR